MFRISLLESHYIIIGFIFSISFGSVVHSSNTECNFLILHLLEDSDVNGTTALSH